jgi:hypothetical protein
VSGRQADKGAGTDRDKKWLGRDEGVRSDELACASSEV